MSICRNLHFYECVGLVPIFLYSNTYVATEELHNFYHNKELKQVKYCFFS